MQLKRIKLRGAEGLKPYGDEIEIDFNQFDSGPLALVGINGAGKSTILENLHPWPTLISRNGSLTAHYHLKDSLKELEFEYRGKNYLCKTLINGERNKLECYLYQDGQPLNDGKIPGYKILLESLFGSPAIFFKSIFISQNGEQISQLKPGRKKEFFAQLLGIDWYQLLAEEAKVRGNKLCDEVATLNGAIEQMKLQIASNKEKIQTAGDIDTDIAGLKNEITVCNDNITAKKAGLEGLKQTAEQCLQSMADIKSIRYDINELLSDKTGVESRYNIAIADFDKQIQAHTATIERLRKCISNADTIRSNVDKIAMLTFTSNELADKKSQIQELNLRKNDLKFKIDSRRQRVRQKIDEFNSSFLNNEKLADQLKTVPCGDTEFVNTCPLIKTARDAQNKLAELENQRAGLQAELKTPIPEEAELEILEKQISELPYDQERHIWITKELNELKKHDWTKLHSELNIAETTINERQRLIESIKQQIEFSRNDYLAQVKTIDDKIRAKNIEIDKLRNNLPVYPDDQIKAAVEELNRLENEHTWANTRLGQLQAQLTALIDLKDDTDKLVIQLEDNQKQHQTITNDIADWILLERAFGKNGLQALELDSACPEISSIATEILQGFGREWSITIRTVRDSADGKKDIETFEIIVSKPSGICNFDNLSGGEKVWVEESIRKAVTIYLINSSGRDYKTLYQDEADGALDPGRAQAFLDTAFKAHELTGVHHTIIITQRPEIWQQINQRIMLDPEKGVIETVIE
jgi:exonuclease SbcC